jgi:hypothetical protein
MTLTIPEKWANSIDDQKLAKVSRWQLHYRIGSGAWAELPVGASLLSMGTDGLLCAPTLSPGPLTLREFLGRAYAIGTEHFVSDQSADGSHPKAADLRLVLLDERDRVIGDVSKKLRRTETQQLREDAGVVEQVTEGANVLAQTVRSLGAHLVSVTSVDARSRTDHESVMCTQMRTVSEAWQEVNKDREKIAIDLVAAEGAKVRAEEESKRLELERQLAEEKGFFDSTVGEQLGSMLVRQLVPKLLGFLDGALATASIGLEKRKMKAAAELAQFKRKIARELELELADDEKGTL